MERSVDSEGEFQDIFLRWRKSLNYEQENITRNSRYGNGWTEDGDQALMKLEKFLSKYCFSLDLTSMICFLLILRVQPGCYWLLGISHVGGIVDQWRLVRIDNKKEKLNYK